MSIVRETTYQHLLGHENDTMGTLHSAPPALLFLAVAAAPSIPPALVTDVVSGQWGELAGESESYDFDRFTTYYAAEMGAGLTKRLLVFLKPVRQEVLPDLKLTSNSLETLWLAESGDRRVNLDPGLLTPYALILASTKANSNRVYLRDGIYAEITLRYEGGEYVPNPWTYPDYRQPMVREFLLRWRPAALALQHAAEAAP